ncbi:hypothetical protein D9M69_490190 [compost metagenome]
MGRGVLEAEVEQAGTWLLTGQLGEQRQQHYRHPDQLRQAPRRLWPEAQADGRGNRQQDQRQAAAHAQETADQRWALIRAAGQVVVYQGVECQAGEQCRAQQQAAPGAADGGQQQRAGEQRQQRVVLQQHRTVPARLVDREKAEQADQAQAE